MENATHFGILSLIPVVGFLVIALITRKTITSIVISGLLGYLIYYKEEFIWPTLDGLVMAFTDYDNAYIVIIVLLFGCLIRLLKESKGAEAFGELAGKYANTPKKGLMATWLAGVVLFVDDYLSILVSANALMPVNDKHKTPREMLAYVINTTSAPMCIIIPISAFAVYFAGIFEAQPEALVLGETGIEIYYSIIPYFFYAFLCVLFVPLVILGIVPKMGGIKKAYERVEATGALWPESSNVLNKVDENVVIEGGVVEGGKARLWPFLLPMIALIAVVIWQRDVLLGVVVALVVCLIYIPAKIISFDKFTDCCYKGLEDMLFIAAMLVVSLFYREAITLVGLSDYVIEVVEPLMSESLLPAITFLAVGLLCFATGSIWSLPAITAPIIVPLAVAMGANLPLTLGALISASAFGAQSCFYSDVTLMTSSACKVNNLDYGLAQIPYVAIVGTISFIMYIVAGFVL